MSYFLDEVDFIHSANGLIFGDFPQDEQFCTLEFIGHAVPAGRYCGEMEYDYKLTDVLMTADGVTQRLTGADHASAATYLKMRCESDFVDQMIMEAA